MASDEANLALSRRRAEAISAYLTGTLGVPASRMSAVGYGETQPIANNDTPQGRARNRRIDVLIEPQLGAVAAVAEHEPRAARRAVSRARWTRRRSRQLALEEIAVGLVRVQPSRAAKVVFEIDVVLDRRREAEIEHLAEAAARGAAAARSCRRAP